MFQMARTNTRTAPATSAKSSATVDPWDAAVDAYHAASGAEKSRVRRDADASMRAALIAGDASGAMAWLAATEKMVASRPTADAPDYVDIVARRIVTLRGAAESILNGSTRPAGIPDDVDLSAVAARVATMSYDDVSADDMSAVASAKVARSAVRRDIADVVRRAFDVTGKNRLTVAAIARHGATDDYTPSGGAVAARMFGGRGVDGFTAHEATADAPRTITRD
jgi:hypothetical protein